MPEQNDPAIEPAEPLEVWREPYGPWKVDDPSGELSAFEVAVLEEVLNTPLESQPTGDHRLVTEDEWFWTIAGNA
jgi:hypothetical protein